MWILTLFAALGLGVRTAPSCSPSAACSCSDEWQVRDKEHLRSLVPRAAAVFEGVVLASEWGPQSDGGVRRGLRARRALPDLRGYRPERPAVHDYLRADSAVGRDG